LARKSIFVSDLSGREISEGKGAQVTTGSSTPGRGAFFSMSPTRKARSWAAKVGGRLDVVAGQRPLRATEPGRGRPNLERGKTMAAKGKKAGTEKAATSGKSKPKKKISRGK
jgi:hypothetical protein